MGEIEYIRWLRRTERPAEGVVLGIGDDAAILRSRGKYTLVSTDMIVEGVDFDLAKASPYLVGRKALAINLSDIAAMGARPTYAVVAVAFRPGLPPGFGRELHEGMSAVASTFDVTVVGGDVGSTDGGLVVCATILGTDDGREPVRRSGARPGDWVCATGEFGGSIHGHHLTFTPRVREGMRLASEYRPHAMIDVSDGLAADLGHILEESHVGAVIDEGRIPIAEAAVEAAQRTNRTPLDHALHDGEDFELVFTLAPEDGERLLAAKEFGAPVTRIGEIRSEPGLFLRRGGNVLVPLAPKGFEHPHVVI